MSQSPALRRIRPPRRIQFALLTLGCLLAGLPAASASAVADGVLEGTVTFHGTTSDRTLEVYRETAPDTWTEDESRETTIAPNGSYRVRVPGGEPVKLRVSYGEKGYWYGDGFDVLGATPVTASAGMIESYIDLELPVPVEYSGRLLDRGGDPVSGYVIPTVNTDGASRSLVVDPIPVGETGAYRVTLPTRYGGSWYEAGILGFAGNDTVGTWLGGGEGGEPDFYLNPLPGESYAGQDIMLPVGTERVVSPTTTPAPPRLLATRPPVIRGVTRRGRTLHSSTGAWTRRPTSLRYQWLRNGRAIRGAHSSAYRLRRADVHKRLRVRVTAYRSGTKASAVSARTALIRRR